MPPAPWTNVVANPRCGFLATESGGGYTWSGNSQANRLTPWNNDPVSDQPGEVVYLRDEESGEVPRAFIVRQSGAELSADAVIDFVASQVAPHKKVRMVDFIDTVPKSASGKILRKDLKGRPVA